jgi:hypothetical protein
MTSIFNFREIYVGFLLFQLNFSGFLILQKIIDFRQRKVLVVSMGTKSLLGISFILRLLPHILSSLFCAACNKYSRHDLLLIDHEEANSLSHKIINDEIKICNNKLRDESRGNRVLAISTNILNSIQLEKQRSKKEKKIFCY